MESRRTAVAVMTVGLVAHAFTPLWTKLANFDPGTSAFLRCGIAALVLLPLMVRERRRIGGIDRRGMRLALISGIVLGIDFLCYNYSVFYAGAGITAILLNIQIVVLPLLALIVDGERPHRSFWLLLPVVFAALAATGGLFDPADEVASTIYGIDTNLLGTILGATSGSIYGFYLYFSRKAGVLNPGAFVQVMFWSISAQLIPVVIFTSFVAPRGWDISHGVLTRRDGVLALPDRLPTRFGQSEVQFFGDAIGWENWMWIVLLAVVGHAMVWLFIQIGSVNLTPALTATMLLLSPVASVVLAAALLGERPSAYQYLGIVVVLACLAYLSTTGRGTMKPAERDQW